MPIPTSFFIPETAYAEAEEHLAALVINRGRDPAKAVRLLRSIVAVGTLVSRDVYADLEAEARKRLAARDPGDWPILAAAPHPVPVYPPFARGVRSRHDREQWIRTMPPKSVESLISIDSLLPCRRP